jgi:hypothetical protein
MKSIKPKLLASCKDHMMDGFDYAMIPWYNTFYNSFILGYGHYYFPKPCPQQDI